MREDKRISQSFHISDESAEFADVYKLSNQKENRHPSGRHKYSQDDTSHGSLPPITSPAPHMPQFIQRQQHKNIMVHQSQRPPQLINTQLRPAMYHRTPRPPPTRLPPLEDQNHMRDFRTRAVHNHMKSMTKSCQEPNHNEKSGVNQQADVPITENDKGYRNNTDTKNGLKQDLQGKIKDVTKEAKAVLTKCATRTSITTILNCPDAPLLPGRREHIVPHPPAYPKPKTGAETKEEKDEKLPEINVQPTKNKNIFVCHPPDKPRIDGVARRKWRNSTMRH